MNSTKYLPPTTNYSAPSFTFCSFKLFFFPTTEDSFCSSAFCSCPKIRFLVTNSSTRLFLFSVFCFMSLASHYEFDHHRMYHVLSHGIHYLGNPLIKNPQTRVTEWRRTIRGKHCLPLSCRLNHQRHWEILWVFCIWFYCLGSMRQFVKQWRSCILSLLSSFILGVWQFPSLSHKLDWFMVWTVSG